MAGFMWYEIRMLMLLFQISLTVKMKRMCTTILPFRTVKCIHLHLEKKAMK